MTAFLNQYANVADDEVDYLVLLKPHPMFRDDALFFEFCLANQELRIERSAHGELKIMPPTGTETSAKNSLINRKLGNWCEEQDNGVVTDSNGAFTLPDTSVKAPDVAWIAMERWLSLPLEDRKKFAHICPDFVIELMSESDKLKASQHTMEEWMKNGCRLGWLIDPQHEKVYIYRPEGLIQTIEGFDNKLSGEEVLLGFELELKRLRG